MSVLSLRYGAELEQLAVVVEQLPIGVIIFDKRRYEIVFSNNAALRLLHPVNVRRGREVPDPWPAFSLRHYAGRLADPGVAPQQRVEIDDGRVFDISGIASRDTETGVILIEDVSYQERRSRAEREFVANAAHELLTPLTGIIGAAHVLEAGAKDVPDERDRFLAHITHECSRLARVARSLLTLARAQSGEEPPRLEIVPLCELVDDAIETAKSEREVEISSRCDPALTVFADADLFAQAFVNLLTNAVRHGSGAAIVVDAEDVGAGLIRIEIRDKGARLSAAEGERMQRRFRSGEGRDSGGFGLGLSIAEQSLEVMGGTLFVAPADSVVARVELPAGRVRT